MGKVLDAAEKLWTGQTTTLELNPLTTFDGFEELADGLGFVSSMANVTAVVTDEGFVVIDTGSFVTGPLIGSTLRGWRDSRVHTAVYTHGHVDHACGTPHLPGAGTLRVIAHEAVPHL